MHEGLTGCERIVLDVNDLSFMMNDMNDSHLSPEDAGRFVSSVVRRIVRDPDAADDVAQDALLLAHRYRASFRGESSYRTWLYRIAQMSALGYLRKRRRSRELLAIEDREVGADTADPAPSPHELAETREEAAIVQRALDAMGEKYRDVLLLRARDLSESEIADHLGVTVANVKIRTHRARQQLRGALVAA